MTTTGRLERFISFGLVGIVAVMPFYAFLVVWLGSLTGHETAWQALKEILTTVMALAGLYLVVTQTNLRRRLMTPLNGLVLAFGLLALVVTAITRPSAAAALYGLKTDVEFLVLFILAQLVASRALKSQLVNMLLISSGIAAAIALLLAFALPPDFLTHFGYGPHTIEPYERVSFGISTIRTPGTLSGPNQLGSFLILPLCAAVVLAIRRWRWWQLPLIVILLGGIWVSYSRAALLGALIGAALAIVLTLKRRPAIITSVIMVAVALVGAALLLTATKAGSSLQYYVLHQGVGGGANGSTSKHIAAFQNGLTAMIQAPWGRGLGTAGPASYHSAQPFIPESYYLQIGVETGFIGLILFLGVLIGVILALWRQRQQGIAPALLGALVGLSLVNLVLHGWADASTAFVFWILAGCAIGLGQAREAARG